MMKHKLHLITVGKKVLTLTCSVTLLLANAATMTVHAGALGGIGGWLSDRAEDVSSIASDAGQAIADSDAGQFIGEKASIAGETIGDGLGSAGAFIGENATAAADWVVNSDAGQFVSEYAGIAGEWIGTNAAAAGKMIGENAAIARVWIGDNAEIAGSFIGENASAAVDWLGMNGSNACNWIVENGTIVGAWIGEKASGAGVWIGDNASAAGTMIGETASGAGIWINEKVTDINKWIEDNSLFSEDGIAVLGDNLSAFGIEKTEELEALAIGVKNYVENIDPSVYTTKEYYIQTGEKLLLGEYSDANMTGLAVGLNVVASIVNIDLAMDLRDLAYDIQYIGDGSVGIVELGIDAASCLPVIGVVKNIKYIDDIKDVAKAVDGIADVADSAKDASKVADVIDDVKEISKVIDAVDDVKDVSKAADVVDEIKDASKIVDAADGVKEASKVADAADEVKDASKVADVADEVKDASKAADTVDEVKDASKAADTADEVKDASNTAEAADETVHRYIECRNQVLEGTQHPITGVKFERRIVTDVEGELVEGVFPKFDSVYDATLPKTLYEESNTKQFKEANRQLLEQIENYSALKEKFTAEQLDQIAKGVETGKSPDGFIWHHNEESGVLQLVDKYLHENTGHTGGRTIWGGGYE